MRRSFASPDRVRKWAIETAEKDPLRTWWHGKYEGKDLRPFGKRTTGDLLREYYLDKAMEMVQLRERLASGDADNDGKLAERLTALEDAFQVDERSDGPTGDKWIDEQMALMKPEVKEFNFGP